MIKCLICVQRLGKNQLIDCLIDCFDKMLDLCAETGQVSAAAGTDSKIHRQKENHMFSFLKGKKEMSWLFLTNV